VIGIVIVAHGGLAAELKRATEHVVGPQAAMVAISIGPRMTAPPARRDLRCRRCRGQRAMASSS
jgi:mannose/fructose-specific phosphotransferase system component IIA